MVVWDFRLNDVEDGLEFYGWDGMGYPLTFWRTDGVLLFSLLTLRCCEILSGYGLVGKQ